MRLLYRIAALYEGSQQKHMKENGGSFYLVCGCHWDFHFDDVLLTNGFFDVMEEDEEDEEDEER